MPVLLVFLALGMLLTPGLGHAQAAPAPSAVAPVAALPSEPPPGSFVSPELQRQQQLQHIDAQLAPLLAERHRYNLGLPITLMATSFAAAAFGCVFAFSVVSGSDKKNLDVALYSTVGAVAGAVFLAGAVLMAVRIPKRRVHAPQIRELKLQRRALSTGLSLAPLPARAAGLSLVGRF